ncbi:PilW family protein [Desulfitobacterium sp.]|uniref:PilW family protein n=1 Tax=Desulfitobacterium sp. TaxID=49981 RepID=UPI002BD85A9B|nr:prepilin-type N-terminal cleavage/methylation domain-containing protein [Desulfitobacterium sp.]HVJ48873.1 prepilin-type N-terminal cleavage/methylation domain-containing protein [Desulfitobacterium sp.]
MRTIKFVRSFQKKATINSKGFTLIEVMIAIAIFGFLMLYVSQMMRGEIHVLNTVTRQSTVEQNARVTMMHILDEIRLHQATYYDGSTDFDKGIYFRNPSAGADTKICLFDLNPTVPLEPNNLPVGTGIYFDLVKHEVWYRDITQNPNANYRIAEYIDSITITPADQSGHLIKINLNAKDPTSTANFNLVTWVRLY